MEGQKEKHRQYGMEGFCILLFLMLGEMLLETFWEAFGTVPSTVRILFLMLIGISYFLLRCLFGRVPVSKSYGFDGILGGAFALTGVYRVSNSLLHPEQMRPEMQPLLLVFWIVFTLVFLFVAMVGLIRFLRQRK